MRRLGILTNGGDAPGINSAIKWITKKSLDDGVANEVIGIKDGYQGLIERDVIQLDEQRVRTWDREGGTKLGAERTNPFNIEGKDKTQELISSADRLGLDWLIVIGGDGSLSIAAKLYQIERKLRIVGIPKTIDLDVEGTDYTLGLLTAVEENHEVINKLRNPAGSHKIIYVVEVMGRNAGHLALYSGMVGAAAIILIPEYQATINQVIDRLRERRNEGARYDIVVVAEGAKIGGIAEITTSTPPKMYIGDLVADEIKRLTGYETRSNRPGHIQRGARPNSFDVLMGRMYGIHAVDLIKRAQYGHMVSRRNGAITEVPLEVVLKGPKLVDVHRQYDQPRLNAIRNADEFPLF